MHCIPYIYNYESKLIIILYQLINLVPVTKQSADTSFITQSLDASYSEVPKSIQNTELQTSIQPYNSSMIFV